MQLGRTRSREEGNIDVNLKCKGWGKVNLIRKTQEKIH